MNDFHPAPPLRGVTRYLMMLALAFPGSVTAQSEQPKQLKWQGIETFENAYTFSGRTSAHLGNVNEYNHKIIVRFTYVEETDTRGAKKFTSRKIGWTAEGKAVATKFTSTTCNGSGSLELVGLSDEDLYKKLKIPCTTADKGILAGSFTKPPDRIRPPKIVDWEKLRDTCSYSEESIAPSGERYTYSVWVSPGCKCGLKPPKKTGEFKVTAESLSAAFVKAFDKRGVRTSGDFVQINETEAEGSKKFLIRLGREYNLLPSPDWLVGEIAKGNIRKGSQEGSNYTLLGLMQASTSLCKIRINTRIVVTETGVVNPRTGKGDADLSQEGLEQAVDEALGELGIEFKPFTPLRR